MFGDLADSSAADWVGAIGTIVATIVTAIVALAGYFRDISLRTESARNSTLLAVGLADRAAHQLERADEMFNGVGNVRHGAKYFLSYPVWLEVVEGVNELRPQDMPDIHSTEYYISLRSYIRSVTKILSDIAALPPSVDGKIDKPDLRNYAEQARRVQRALEQRAEDLERPFYPKWLKIIKLKRELRKLEK